MPDLSSRTAPDSNETNDPRSSISIVSSETGGPSKPSSLNPASDLPVNVTVGSQNGSGSRRSHKSRNSGGFLLSNTFEFPARTSLNEVSPAPTSTSAKPRGHSESKGKSRTPETRHKSRASFGLGIGGSPLATAITNVSQEKGQVEGGEKKIQETTGASTEQDSTEGRRTSIDPESAQIVNLALNLSESRKIVARRNISSPLPPTLPSFGEGTAGGSLRQYLQQQRRSSRNISPKPDRSDRAFTASPRVSQTQRIESPLQSAFGTNGDDEYDYNFSASTLARAEKAKKAINLMAHYRSLLQYVPPLKPQTQVRLGIKSSLLPNPSSPNTQGSPLSRTNSASASPQSLGRVYNPLQYIRNRKVRARERNPIDGDGQGFGDVDNVGSWINSISEASTKDGYWVGDTVTFPEFPNSRDATKLPSSSPSSALSRNQNKVKRSRVDWIIQPADMIADVYWLEQGENKKQIEDNRERKLFPQDRDLSRPLSANTVEPNTKSAPAETPEKLKEPLRLETDLPSFNSVRDAHGHQSGGPRGRAIRKLHKAAHRSEDLNKLGHEPHPVKSNHQSSSESSDDEKSLRLSRHQRSGTAETNDVGSSILEKQMRELLAKESLTNEIASRRSNSARPPDDSTMVSVNARSSTEGKPRGRDRTSSNLSARNGTYKRDSLKPSDSQSSSNRASTDMARHVRQGSTDVLDITAPNSPASIAVQNQTQIRPTELNLSPPVSRKSSPVRKPALERMRSKITSFHDRSRNHSRAGSLREVGVSVEDFVPPARSSLDIPATPLRRKRSQSPVKVSSTSKTSEGVKSSNAKTGSTRRRGEEEPSGIKGLFKGGRNPVTRVGDIIWRKDQSPASGSVSGVSSNASTDISDLEDEADSAEPGSSVGKGSKDDDFNKVSLNIPKRSYNLPTFTSPFDRRENTRVNSSLINRKDSNYLRKHQRTREERMDSGFSLLRAPRIDIQNASPRSSPDFTPADRRGSNASDTSGYFGDRRTSYAVQDADARLNSILGLPGSAFHRLPVTGLSRLDDNRRPSMAGKRQWSGNSDRSVSTGRALMSKREIERVRTLLLTSGIKANQIMLQAGEMRTFGKSGKGTKLDNLYSKIAALNRNPEAITPVPKSQEHMLAARILFSDVELSSRIWNDSANTFINDSVGGLMQRIDGLKETIMGNGGLSDLTRRAADDTDALGRDLVTVQTLQVKALVETMQGITRRRRARFRWARRGGWVVLEWMLVGVMWWAWLIVVLLRSVRGLFRGGVAAVRWLFWL